MPLRLIKDKEDFERIPMVIERDNVFQLDMILRSHHQSFKKLYMASIDVAKAFPSVLHKALIEALRSFGMPAEFLRYTEYLYENRFTILQGQGWNSDKIIPKRGVRQEDPLSSPTFNILTHRLLKNLPRQVGVDIEKHSINASAFVDDMNLYSRTPRGLQALIDSSVEFLSQCGMSINTEKSFALGFKPSAKDKISTGDTNTTFKTTGRFFKTMTRGCT